MDGFPFSGSTEVSADRPYLGLIAAPETKASEPVSAEPQGIEVERLEEFDTVVITKTAPGFDAAAIAFLRDKIRDAAAGRLGRLKFLVIDFAHEGQALPRGDEGFDALITEAANLILAAPVVLVANARGVMSGVDMEFALACSMLIGGKSARFCFGEDPIVSLETYGFLAQKLGFVRAERLMESAEVLDAAQMHELLLLKEVIEDEDDLEGLKAFLAKTARRHNSCYGIYRAHRMASPIARQAG